MLTRTQPPIQAQTYDTIANRLAWVPSHQSYDILQDNAGNAPI